ncbi:hypothetical protein KPL70_014468 [Citrus sinensis]|nr:hypothetical protein KPL70_014468 [Citrus sinensis]
MWNLDHLIVLSIPLLTSYTYIAMLSGFSLAFFINCASVMKNVLAVSIITGLFLLQNRAVEQHQRGAANGLAMTVVSLTKTAGPAVGGLNMKMVVGAHTNRLLVTLILQYLSLSTFILVHCQNYDNLSSQ